MVNESKIRQTFIGLLIPEGLFLQSEKLGTTSEKLRNVLQAISSDSCFSEQMLFDVTRNRFGITFRLLRLFTVIDIIRSKTIQCHVWTPGVIPILELHA